MVGSQELSPNFIGMYCVVFYLCQSLCRSYHTDRDYWIYLDVGQLKQGTPALTDTKWMLKQCLCRYKGLSLSGVVCFVLIFFLICFCFKTCVTPFVDHQLRTMLAIKGNPSIVVFIFALVSLQFNGRVTGEVSWAAVSSGSSNNTSESD